MSVYLDKAKNRWRVEVTRDGQRRRVLAPAGATKAEAQQLEAQIIRSAWLGTLGKKADPTVADALAKWAAEELPGKKSEYDYRNHAWHLLQHCAGYLLKDAAEAAEAYKRANKHLAAATIYQRLAVLRRVCNLAHRRWDWLDNPVGEKISMPAINNARHLYLTRDEALALLIAADKQHTEDAILIGCYTGMRLGEIVGLTQANIVGDLILLGSQTKTGKPRAIPIHHVLIDAVGRLPLGVGKSTVQQAFMRARASIGRIDIHFHDLRHTTASWLVQADVPLYTAGALLGHASTKTTARYAHLATDSLRDAVGKLGGQIKRRVA